MRKIKLPYTSLLRQFEPYLSRVVGSNEMNCERSAVYSPPQLLVLVSIASLCKIRTFSTRRIRTECQIKYIPSHPAIYFFQNTLRALSNNQVERTVKFITQSVTSLISFKSSWPDSLANPQRPPSRQRGVSHA